MSSFFAELKRRNVVKVGLAYAILAWLIAAIHGHIDSMDCFVDSVSSQRQINLIF